MDPFVASAQNLLDQAVEDLSRSLDGLPSEGLNWRPGEQANSIAVLAVHVMNSTRWWLSVATGAPLPKRDRDSEFVASSDDATSLRAWVEDMAEQCRALLNADAKVDWGAMLKPDPDGRELPAAWALLHAMQHLREHEGQMSLTRQMWDAREAE